MREFPGVCAVVALMSWQSAFATQVGFTGELQPPDIVGPAPDIVRGYITVENEPASSLLPGFPTTRPGPAGGTFGDYELEPGVDFTYGRFLNDVSGESSTARLTVGNDIIFPGSPGVIDLVTIEAKATAFFAGLEGGPVVADVFLSLGGPSDVFDSIDVPFGVTLADFDMGQLAIFTNDWSVTYPLASFEITPEPQLLGLLALGGVLTRGRRSL